MTYSCGFKLPTLQELPTAPLQSPTNPTQKNKATKSHSNFAENQHDNRQKLRFGPRDDKRLRFPPEKCGLGAATRAVSPWLRTQQHHPPETSKRKRKPKPIHSPGNLRVLPLVLGPGDKRRDPSGFRLSCGLRHAALSPRRDGASLLPRVLGTALERARRGGGGRGNGNRAKGFYHSFTAPSALITHCVIFWKQPLRAYIYNFSTVLHKNIFI